MLRSTALAFFLLLFVVHANEFQKFLFHPVRSVNEISANLLKKHGLVLVKEDNSIIVPDLLVTNRTESENKPRRWKKWFHFGFSSKLHYTQTRLSSKRHNVTLSDVIPVDGCIDNRYSDTVTTISKTYSRMLLFEAGPHVYLSILGIEAGGLLHLGYFNIKDEKLTCDVNPGQMLQFQATVATINVLIEQQRNILVIQRFLSRDRIKFSDWYPSKLLTPLSFQSTTLACVTNPDLLIC